MKKEPLKTRTPIFSRPSFRRKGVSHLIQEDLLSQSRQLRRFFHSVVLANALSFWPVIIYLAPSPRGARGFGSKGFLLRVFRVKKKHENNENDDGPQKRNHEEPLEIQAIVRAGIHFRELGANHGSHDHPRPIGHKGKETLGTGSRVGRRDLV